MRENRGNGTAQVQSTTDDSSVPGDSGIRGAGDRGEMVGRRPSLGQPSGEVGTIPSRLHDPSSPQSKRKRDVLASIEADSRRGPEFDPEAGERWPTLQECLSCTLTDKGLPRAGGEVKTLAVGFNYRTTLIMPEEGVQVTVVHNALSKAWDALEHVLCLEPVPWVECSEFAVRRAKQRGKKKPENKVD